MNGASELQLINTDPSAGDNEIGGPLAANGGARPRITSTTSSHELSPPSLRNGEVRSRMRQGEPADELLEDTELKQNETALKQNEIEL